MVENYERHLAKTGGTTMRHGEYGIDMHAAEDLTNGDSLTEAVTKFAERAT